MYSSWLLLLGVPGLFVSVAVGVYAHLADAQSSDALYESLTIVWSFFTLVWAFALRKAWQRRESMLGSGCRSWPPTVISSLASRAPKAPAVAVCGAEGTRCGRPSALGRWPSVNHLPLCQVPTLRLGYRWSVHGSTGQDVAVLPHFKGTLVVDEVTGEYVAWSSPTVRHLEDVATNPNPNTDPNPYPNQVRHLKYVAGGLISFGLVSLAVMLQSLPDIYQVSRTGGWVGGWVGEWVGGRRGQSTT